MFLVWLKSNRELEVHPKKRMDAVSYSTLLVYARWQGCCLTSHALDRTYLQNWEKKCLIGEYLLKWKNNKGIRSKGVSSYG